MTKLWLPTMNGILRLDRPTVVWVLLMLATALSWAVGRGQLAGDSLASASVIAIAFVKVRWIGLDFMELRAAPIAMRVGFELWVLTTAAVLIALCMN